MKLTLYSKPDCHLCAEALRELERLRTRHPFELEIVDITSTSALQQQYGERIPVLVAGGHEYDAPLDRGMLERALREAAAQR
jgi:glutaredoxin